MKGAFRTLKKHGFCYIYLLPFFSLFALFVIAPVLVAIVLSFTDFNMLQTPDFVWLDNYSVLLSGDNIFIFVLKDLLFLFHLFLEQMEVLLE